VSSYRVPGLAVDRTGGSVSRMAAGVVARATFDRGTDVSPSCWYLRSVPLPQPTCLGGCIYMQAIRLATMQVRGSGVDSRNWPWRDSVPDVPSCESR